MSIEELNALVESAYEAAFEFETKLTNTYMKAFDRAAEEASAKFLATAVTAAGFVAPPVDSLTSGMTEAEITQANRVRDQAADAIAAALTALGLTAVAVSFMEAISQRGQLNFDQELLRVLRTTVEKGLAEGWSADETAIQIQKTFQGVSTPTAQMLAQTELTTLVNERSLEAAQKNFQDRAAPAYKTWECLLPETRVRGLPVRVSRREQGTGGRAISISIASGGFGDPTEPDRNLTVTPNHPILTGRGWIEAEFVQPGDRVFGCPSLDGEVVVQPNVENAPPTIVEVFETAALARPAEWMMSSVVNLDGEREDCEVEVVTIEGELRDRVAAQLNEELPQFLFSLSDLDLVEVLAERNLGSVGFGSWSSAQLQSTFAGRSQGGVAVCDPPGFPRLGLTPNGDASAHEDSFDRLLAGTDVTADACDRLAGFVAPLEVASVEVIPWEGYVYNLETENSWFIADSIIVHNTMKDPRVRAAHAATQGQTVPISQPFDVAGFSMMYPGDPSAPMSLVARCFPADTLVAGSIEAAVRSRFDGRMMVLHTRSGKSLSGTENHPILTLSGWKVLGEIEEGDHLVCAGFDQRSMPGAFDVEDTPSSIEEVFDALAEAGCSHRVRSVDVDLYGDTLDGDVDVVWADGLLELPCTPSGFKPAEQFAFAHSNEAQATLALLGVEREFSWSGDAPPGSSLSFGNARLSFVGAESAHPHEHRLGATATLDAPFVQPAFDWLPTDSQASGDLLLGEHFFNVESHDLVGIEREPIVPPVDASLLQVIEDGLVVDSELQPDLGGGHPGFVQTDDVVSVDAFSFHGDVFTLSTEQGYYIANGFVAGNCRCRMSYTGSLTASAKEDTIMPMPTITTTSTNQPLTAGLVVTIEETEDDVAEVEDQTEDTAEGGVEEAMSWKALLAIEGQQTEDGRIIDVGALTWRDLPLSLMAMDETGPGGHQGAQVSGRIDSIERQGNEIWGSGVFDTGEFGQKICRMVGEQTLRGNSVDLAVLAYEYRNADTGEVLSDAELMDAFFGEDIPILFAVTEGVILASTVCPTPAIAGAEIMLASGVMRMTFSFGAETGDVLTAAGAGMAPLHPPTSWFADPRFDGPTPLTVTKEGQVKGHAALWNSCHIGEPSGPGICVPPPRSGMQYEIFHHGVVTTDDGTDIPCGQITMSTFHAGRDLSWKATLEHYENSGCAVADVVAGEDRFGIWVSGGLRPDLPAERVREMKAGALSGDWRQVLGRGLEFLAALVVNIPGFPIPRPEARIVASAAGEEEVLALVAAGMVTEEDVDGMSRREYLRKIGALTS